MLDSGSTNARKYLNRATSARANAPLVNKLHSLTRPFTPPLTHSRSHSLVHSLDRLRMLIGMRPGTTFGSGVLLQMPASKHGLLSP